MEGFYNWIRNIVYYLIFITMLTNLLPAGKYEKYLRLFSGCILIMLVLKPLTGSLRLEDQITSLFHSFSFENDMGELTQGMEEMETRRMETLVRQYEKTAADDIRRLAAMEGLEAREVSVELVGDQNSPEFGKIKRVTILLENQSGPPEAMKDAAEKTRETEEGQQQGRPEAKPVDLVDPVNIRVELERGETKNRAVGGEPPDSSLVSAGEGAPSPETEKLRRQISGCYQLEERYVEIRLENE